MRLNLFGPLEVFRHDVRLDQWPRKKARLLLAALALERRGLTSFALAELLGDGDAVAGQAILKVNLPALRKALDPTRAVGAASPELVATGGGYALGWTCVAAVDVEAFRAAMATGDAARKADTAATIAAYETALGHYRGPLLDEPLFATAFAEERSACEQQALSAAAWLAGHAGPTQAERWLRRAVAIAPCDEAAAIALMDHHAAQREPDRLSQAYWDHRKALKQRLGAMPGPAIEARYKARGGPP